MNERSLVCLFDCDVVCPHRVAICDVVRSCCTPRTDLVALQIALSQWQFATSLKSWTPDRFCTYTGESLASIQTQSPQWLSRPASALATFHRPRMNVRLRLTGQIVWLEQQRPGRKKKHCDFDRVKTASTGAWTSLWPLTPDVIFPKSAWHDFTHLFTRRKLGPFFGNTSITW